MTEPRPIEERISRWLAAEAPDDIPHHVLDAAFARSRAMHQEPAPVAWLPRRFALRGRAAALLAATLLLALALVAAAIAGALVERNASDLRSRVHEAGVLRVAVRSAPPQAVVLTKGLAGFDIDVANELGRRLGLRVEIVSVSDVAATHATGSFDLELPSLPASVMDPAATVAGPAYYVWPHYLLVAAGSAVARPGDLTGGTVCAVEGDVAAAWAQEALASPGTVTLVTRTTDDQCLAELQNGRVDAAVTAAIGPNDLAIRQFARPIGGPPAEVRVIVARRSDRPETLLDEVREALRAMAGDGTLGTLSRTRFGVDLATSIAQGG